ncbi:MAG: copper homeostasis protein CutC [Bacteroidia bacterium]|nr:copper homeostasis protein CutC [Bacteroidia bacterium]
MNKLEIACFNYQSALIAQQGGADRIELCDNFKEGGTTPDYSIVAKASNEIKIDLFVMIRPRGGNFVYTSEEFEQMKKDILHFKNLNVDGFVFGILNEDNSINIQQNKELIQLASPLPCSFHRAFDKIDNQQTALESVINCGFKTILTSGFTSSAMNGIKNLEQLVKASRNRITIMPGGGVRSSNIAQIKNKTQAHYYHSSAIIQGDIADVNEVKKLKEQLN